MKNIQDAMRVKLVEIQKEMKQMEYENLYWLKEDWKVCRAQEKLLQELLSL